jgi:tRNA(Ile)-lysidine synthase
LRNHLIPLLEEVSDKGLAGVLKSIQLLSNERKLVHYAVNILSENARLKTDKEKILFDLHYLHQLDLLDAALYHLLSPFGFSGVQCQQIIQSYRLKRSGKYFYAPHKTAILNRNIVEIINLEPAQEKFTEYFIYKENSMEYPVRIEIEERRVNEQYKTNNNQYIAYFDADKLQWPLKLRYWQEGDAFVPLGMKQLKKLSDFFIDQKISVSDKKNCWIIQNGNGDIIWLPGYRISELAKISDNSKRMCVLKFYTEF